MGCSPWGRKELDMTEWLHFHFDALEKEMATHSSFLAWRISGTEEPGGLPSIGLHRVGQDWSDLAAREQSCVGIGEVCLESQKLHKPLGLTLQYEEKGRVRDGYVASLSQWTWIWANSRDSEGQGNLAFFSPGGCKESDMTEQLNWSWTDNIYCFVGIVTNMFYLVIVVWYNILTVQPY